MRGRGRGGGEGDIRDNECVCVHVVEGEGVCEERGNKGKYM